MQNVQFNVYTFLEKFAKGLRGDVDFAYPHNNLDSDRAHASLQMVLSKVEALEAFLAGIEEVPAAPVIEWPEVKA